MIPKIPICHGPSKDLVTTLDTSQTLLDREQVALDLVDPSFVDNFDHPRPIHKEMVDKIVDTTENESDISCVAQKPTIDLPATTSDY